MWCKVAIAVKRAIKKKNKNIIVKWEIAKDERAIAINTNIKKMDYSSILAVPIILALIFNEVINNHLKFKFCVKFL